MIAYLLKKFPRLSETFVLNEILRQEGLGEDIHIFSRREVDDEPRHPQFSQLKAEVEQVPSASGSDPWRELFLNEDLNGVSLDHFASVVRDVLQYDHPRLHKLITEALYVRRRCSELGIEHIHVHFATDSSYVAMLVRELGGPTYSITAHAKDIYRSAVHAGLLSRMIESSAFTVTVCDANVVHLDNILTEPAAKNVRRLYNGIDLELFEWADSGRDEEHVIGVGRLVPKKGFDVLLRALALMRDQGRKVKTTIVGTGTETEALEALIAELDLGDQVTLTGAQNQAFVQELMARATVHCLPCVVATDGNKDALPTVLLESISGGLPCISTTVSGIPEILDQGEAGIIVEQGDVQGTADALVRLLDDPDLRTRLAKRGREHAEECFDAQKQAVKLQGWFKEVCAGGVGA
ncbi:MAG TPA: colanic acid biosynthesis glycosyltransferase WcaL [Planctomycetes bacterium]|nr:colanic acid biosynthesis glycosyltransferase WcaL [Planctomycetota bacterium]HIK61078.1 colanic acid biosynthesis glycosyltransferase WcaL [Planctomycetota bacterium]